MDSNNIVNETIDVRGNLIRYTCKGTGEPILYLHDLNGLEKWRRFHEGLAEQFSIYMIEIPGFGESERPNWLTSMDDMSFFFLDVLDALELDRVHIIGHSLGGWLAADIASKYTERIKKLILINPMGLYLPNVDIPDIFMLSPDRVKELFYYDPSFPDEEPDFLMKSRADTMTARLAWNPRFHDPKLKYRLHRAKMPAMLVWGESNQFIPSEYAYEYKNLIPQAELKFIPQCGHLPQVEQPDELKKIVNTFLIK